MVTVNFSLPDHKIHQLLVLWHRQVSIGIFSSQDILTAILERIRQRHTRTNPYHLSFWAGVLHHHLAQLIPASRHRMSISRTSNKVELLYQVHVRNVDSFFAA
jgi:hypothetical protein